MKERRYDIDWLRVIAMLCVFILHCTRFFDFEDWHLKVAVAEQSEIWSITRGFFLWVWLMEMFFLVSGFATRFALQRRSGRQYLRERVKRLLVPLYTVGMFVLVPPQVYFERLTHGEISGSFWGWLPAYFRGLPGEVLSSLSLANPASLLLYNFTGHLWFIQMLFVISLATLPLLLYLKSERGLRLIERLAGWSSRPGGIFLFVVPLAIVRVGLWWPSAAADRWWGDFLWYALYFVIGFILACDDRFTQAMKRQVWIGLGLWIVLFWGVAGLLYLGLDYDTAAKGPGFSLLYVIWQTAWSIISWSSVVCILGLAAGRLNFTNRLLAYSNEAVLPFYLFHQTIILIVGWFILPLDLPVLAKFLIIAGISFPLILALYEVFVRRFGFMRFLFGMAPKAAPPVKEPRLRPV
jgi:surface polysaccharide O-acyltransferase-like enzyme